MNRIEDYYDGNCENEWQRLERHRVEYAMTLRAMEEYLPAPPAAILDIGGATGRYSIELSRRGHSVTLVDLSGQCLEFAKAKAAEAGVELDNYIQADTRDLSRFEEESFDAVLLMGPLYHLLAHEDRLQAVREARRVLRANGPVFASFICRHAAIHYAAKHNADYVLTRSEELDTILSTGVYHRPEGEMGFIDAWFAHPADIPPLMAEGGFDKLDLVACEPLVNEMEEGINQTSGELWERWVDLLYSVAKDPSILGAAGHLLYVGRKF